MPSELAPVEDLVGPFTIHDFPTWPRESNYLSDDAHEHRSKGILFVAKKQANPGIKTEGVRSQKG